MSPSFVNGGLGSTPAYVPQVEVTFDIDANGILSVAAKDLGTGKEQKLRVEAATKIDEKDIDRMVKEAEANKDADKARRESVEAKNQLDGLIFSTEKSLKDAGDKVPADVKSDVESALTQAKAKLDSTDVKELQAARENLETKSHKLAELLYKQASADQGAAEGDASGSRPQHDPNVVDAEFEDQK